MPIAHDAILQSMTDGVVILDVQLRIIELNRPRNVSLDGKNQKWQGSHIIWHYRSIRIIRTEARYVWDKSCGSLGEEENRRYYSVYISPIGIKQNLNGHLLILHDDTERVKAEIESRDRAILEKN